MHSRYFVAAEESPAKNNVADNSNTDDIPMMESHQELDDEEQMSCMLPPISEIDKKCLRAKWILKTRETQSCTENLLSDVTDMCTNIIDELKADVLLKYNLHQHHHL